MYIIYFDFQTIQIRNKFFYYRYKKLEHFALKNKPFAIFVQLLPITQISMNSSTRSVLSSLSLLPSHRLESNLLDCEESPAICSHPSYLVAHACTPISEN